MYPEKVITNRDGYAIITLTAVKAGHYIANARAADGRCSAESSNIDLEFAPDVNSAVLSLTISSESIVANASVVRKIQV